MGLFDDIKQKLSTLLDDGTNEDSLYSRRLTPDELLRDRFRLPVPETRMCSVSATIFLRPLGLQAQNLPSDIVDDFYEGPLTISESFLMFECQADPKLLSFALPLSTIRRVKRRGNGSNGFLLEITLYQDLQLVIDLTGMYSTCSEFCKTLSDNLAAQAPLGEQLRRITTSFYSEFMVESAILRKKGKPRQEILAELAVPPGGLGREFGYPGEARAGTERSKMRLWLEYFQRHGRNIGMVRQYQFYKLLRVGLPHALRGECWEVSCGSVHLRMKSRQLYTSLLDEHKDQSSLATEEIAKDLNRSLPEFPAYQSTKGIEKLRRVLTAYSWMAPEVGYCQAMNIVTAALLIYQTEEQAFWTLHVLVNRILPGYYSRTMYGMLLDQKVLECLVERTMPVLWHHFERTDVPLSVVSLPWFLSLFANSMPLPFAFRIIDILMYEGSRALFQVALGVLRVNGESLLQAEDNTAVIGILKSYFDTLHEPVEPRPGMTARAKPITKFQELLVTAFKEFRVVTNQWIHDLRAKHEAPVLSDIESYAKRTQLRNIPKPHNISNDQCGVIYDTFYAALQATRPGLGGNQGELTYYQFITFLSQFIDWVHPRIIPREDAENSQLLRLLFKDWDSREMGSLTLADCIAGLDKLVNRDMMELINYYFSIFSSTNIDKEARLNQRDILNAADGMLMMMRPFSEVHDGAIVLDAQTSKLYAKLCTAGNSSPSSPHTPLSPEQQAALLTKLQQDQSAKYLSAVSSFIQRSFEVAGYKLVEPSLGKAEVNEVKPLILMDDQEKSSAPTVEQGLGIAHFRMVVLADETLELLFSETLRTTIHLTEHGTGVLSGKLGASTFEMMRNVMNEGLHIAGGLWTNDTFTDAKADELDDDITVKASDRALLDI